MTRMSVDSLASARARSSDPERPDSAAAVAAGFVVLYLLLDWVSFVHPMRGTSITPWNPQSALAVALLAWQPRQWWLVAAVLVLAALARGWPAPSIAELTAACTLGMGYLLLALAIRRWLGAVPSITTRRDFIVFMSLIAAAARLPRCCSLAHSLRWALRQRTGGALRSCGAGSAAPSA